MSTSERKKVQDQHRANVAEHDRLKSSGRATTSELRLAKRIDTHMKMALIALEEQRARDHAVMQHASSSRSAARQALSVPSSFQSSTTSLHSPKTPRHRMQMMSTSDGGSKSD